MNRLTFQVALVALAIYLYQRVGAFWAVLCALALVWLSLRWWDLTRTASALGRLATMSHESEANCVLTYTFSLDRVFKSPAVDELFAKLQKNGKAPVATLNDWRKLLADSYSRKYKCDNSFGLSSSGPCCELRFNIKNNVLFLNGEINFADHVYRELEVPYRWTEAGKPEEGSFLLRPQIEAQLIIRVLLVNGMLLLQVGRFDKDYSPKIYDHAAQTFVTLSSFPLIYFGSQHGIPVRYLNLVVGATQSYKLHVTDRGGKRKSAMSADWRSLRKEIGAYQILCDRESEDQNYSRAVKIQRSFEKKREPLLKAGGYQTMDRHEPGLPDYGHTYRNDYGEVFFRNVNDIGDTFFLERNFTDYDEPRPW
jgi:hypothetical protein